MPAQKHTKNNATRRIEIVNACRSETSSELIPDTQVSCISIVPGASGGASGGIDPCLFDHCHCHQKDKNT